MNMTHAHEDEAFECDMGMDGKPMQLFHFRCDVVSGTEIFYWTSSSV